MKSTLFDRAGRGRPESSRPPECRGRILPPRDGQASDPIGGGAVAAQDFLSEQSDPADARRPGEMECGGVGGQASDVEIQAREIIRMRERLNQIFATATGKPLEQIKKDTDRDFWMSAEAAVDYGLVGKIVTSQKEIA